MDYCYRKISESVEVCRMVQNKKKVEREIDLINQITDDSMVDTEKKMSVFMKDNPRMNMDIMAARVIEVMTNMSIEIPEGEETIDMCKAIEDMIKERACIEREEGKLEILTNLVKDGMLTIQEAAKRMNMTEEEFRSKM